MIIITIVPRLVERVEMSSPKYRFYEVSDLFWNYFTDQLPKNKNPDINVLARNIKIDCGFKHNVLVSKPNSGKRILGIHAEDLSNDRFIDIYDKQRFLIPTNNQTSIPMGNKIGASEYVERYDAGRTLPGWSVDPSLKRFFDNTLPEDDGEAEGSSSSREGGGHHNSKHLKDTGKRIRIGKGKAMRVVYEGPRGGTYVKRLGRYVPLSSIR